MAMPSIIANGLTRFSLRQQPAGAKFIVQLEPQDTDFWCWASVAVGIAAAYDDGRLYQCKLAESQLCFHCCPPNMDKQCLAGAELGDVLTRTGNLDGPPIPSSIAQDALLDVVVKQRRPVAIRVEDPDHAGHYVVIADQTANTTDGLEIEDPWHGHWHLPFDALLTGYYSNYRWTTTYMTKKRGT